MTFINQYTFVDELVFRHPRISSLCDEFIALRNGLDEDETARMAGAVGRPEALTPTRPHAGTDSATANLAAGPFTSTADQARDWIAACTHGGAR